MRSVFVWLNSTPSRNGRVLWVPNGVRANRCEPAPVDAPERRQLGAAGVDLVTPNEHVVHVAGVAGRGSVRTGRIVRAERGLDAQVQRPAKLPGVGVAKAPPSREPSRAQVHLEHRVEARRRHVEVVTLDGDLVAVLEVAVAERATRREVPVVDEDLVARRQVHQPVVERDAPQTAVAASALPVDVGVGPVQHLRRVAELEVDQVQASVALALMHRADDGAAHDRRQPARRPSRRRLLWGRVAHVVLPAGRSSAGAESHPGRSS